MKKSHISTIILIIALLVGLSLLLYPTVSDYWNSLHQSQAIASYADDVTKLSEAEYAQIWLDAKAYNMELIVRHNPYLLSEDQTMDYETLLNLSGNGIMGYIEIPSIHCSLPIYHGSDESVLQTAIGHLDWTSLPVGGESSHCVLSGHRGLPRAKLFTNLDRLKEGDTFVLRVLDEVLTYEVDQILIVEPQDTQALLIEEGRDYCTLVTCTPYGINTHRLLVRGHRVENTEESTAVAKVTADGMRVDPLIVAPVIAVPLLIAAVLILLFSSDSGKRKKNL